MRLGAIVCVLARHHSTGYYHAMRLSRQLLNSAFRRPPNMRSQRTSALLGQGLVAYPVGSGMPAYSPLGADMLESIEGLLTTAAVRGGYDRFRLPHVMRNDDLEAGEPVGDQFRSKIIFLQSPLDDYHLLTTPEMMFARMTHSSPLSFRSFPVRCTYTTGIFRDVNLTKSIVTCREFRVFGSISLHTHMDDVVMALDEIRDLTLRVTSSLGINVQEIRRNDPLHSELVCPCAEGDTYLDNGSSRARALSLAIGYQYGAAMEIPIHYRSQQNTLEHPRIVSFALCTNRLLFSVFDAHRDELGFALPASIRPIDAVLIPRTQADIELSERMVNVLGDASIRPALDDRMALHIADRKAFSDYIGAAASLVVHRGALHLARRGDEVSYQNGINPDRIVGAILPILGRGVGDAR